MLAYFFVLGMGGATWAARLPAIKESLHLTDGRLGLALFAVPAGAVLTLTVSGRLTDAFGAVRVMRIAGFAVEIGQRVQFGRFVSGVMRGTRVCESPFVLGDETVQFPGLLGAGCHGEQPDRGRDQDRLRRIHGDHLTASD